MKPFSVILAIKGTKEELPMIKKAVKSVIKLKPTELIIAVDHPIEQYLSYELDEVRFQNKPFIKIRIISVEKDLSWKFQLIHVYWESYKQAKTDILLIFDVDSQVRKEVLLGVDQVGEDNTALVSFTKRLRLKTPSDFIRYFFYRLRVSQRDNVFSGVFWIYRPHFFNLIDEEKIKKIQNGFDTYLTEMIQKSDYKMITRKEKGINASTLQNEDLDWRQFQDGIWFFAHYGTLKKDTTDDYHVDIKRSGLLFNHPLLFILLQSIMYQRFNMIKGYLWAKKNTNHDVVIKAKQQSLNDWTYVGGKLVKSIMTFKDKGTGFT